jgi:cytochrome d ubiquinol oxidase subunit I
MDVLTLSRLQFAVTSCFHFIFVPLTLGLSILVAVMETRYVRTGDETWLRMTKFWGKLFLINFALGVVTGIAMEFQFGMNWAEYSRYVGDIFGAPLAVEATVAFFLESVFIGLWIFGWNRVSKKVHAFSIWMVAIASNLSALWILLANGWMQHPVGYTLRNGRAEMVDFMALLTNPTGWLKFTHTVFSGYVVGAFFVMGVSAWHLLRKKDSDFFRRSFRLGAGFALLSCLLVYLSGDFHAADVAHTQPAKFAAMESIWETEAGVGMNLLVVPDSKGECNAVERFCVPNMVSVLAKHDSQATIQGLKDFPPDERPPVLPTFLGFRLMVGLGTFMTLAALLALWYSRRRAEVPRWVLRLLLFSIPVPYIAGQFGWIVAEVGRQPWIVQGVLKTSQAVSQAITPVQVWASLLGFSLLYGGLGVVDIYLLAKYSRKDPEHDVSYGFVKPPSRGSVKSAYSAGQEV